MHSSRVFGSKFIYRESQLQPRVYAPTAAEVQGRVVFQVGVLSFLDWVNQRANDSTCNHSATKVRYSHEHEVDVEPVNYKVEEELTDKEYDLLPCEGIEIAIVFIFLEEL